MFTGIVEELGVVTGVEDLADSRRLTVRGAAVTGDAGLGDSIAVNGCCLTVAIRGTDEFTADVMHETLRLTTIGELDAGDAVNLERAVTPSTRLGGHIVQGHVDGTGTVLRRTPGERWDVVAISLPAELDRYVVQKGSVAVDGVSLTVVDVVDGAFTVSLIPETLQRTTLGVRQPGDHVNLEVDVVAKYLEKLVVRP